MNTSGKGDKTFMEAMFLEYTPILFNTVFPQELGSITWKLRGKSSSSNIMVIIMILSNIAELSAGARPLTKLST